MSIAPLGLVQIALKMLIRTLDVTGEIEVGFPDLKMT